MLNKVCAQARFPAGVEIMYVEMQIWSPSKCLEVIGLNVGGKFKIAVAVHRCPQFSLGLPGLPLLASELVSLAYL